VNLSGTLIRGYLLPYQRGQAQQTLVVFTQLGSASFGSSQAECSYLAALLLSQNRAAASPLSV
jgi:hypothetical protein